MTQVSLRNLTQVAQVKTLLKKPSKALNGKIHQSQSYGAPLAIWDHTVVLATRHKWMHPTITPVKQAGSWFTYPGRMESWVDLGSMTAARLGIESTTAWSQVWRPNHYATESPKPKSHGCSYLASSLAKITAMLKYRQYINETWYTMMKKFFMST